MVTCPVDQQILFKPLVMLSWELHVMRVYAHTYVQIHIHAITHIYIHIKTHTYTDKKNTHTHTHTHACTHARLNKQN